MNATSKKLLLEVCTASLEDCLTAQTGGADRVELNAALALGGLTPSLGLLREARRALHIPIIAMIRPRPAGFCYSASDFLVMQRDVELALANGADGVAFGILREDGSINRAYCEQIVRQAEGRESVFHRAFDVTPEPIAALDQLIDLGITRVMTSGQQSNAHTGAENIARYLWHAAGRIQILPAGGINPFTLADILARTGCAQVHASLTTMKRDSSTSAHPSLRFGNAAAASEDRYLTTSLEAVQAMRKLLSRAATA
ncbi:copper homeostasis protein CutC [candidate division KSB1 bacterium]|nr:copper homeostasis protein CutC [candidate division KSB1 bacterium]